MQKILYFCSACQYPLDDGIKKINSGLIDEFIRLGHKVTLIVPSSCDSLPNYSDNVSVIRYKKEKNIYKVFRSLLLLQPLYFSLYYDSKIMSKIRTNSYDVLFYDFYPLTQYRQVEINTQRTNEVFLMPDSMQKLALSLAENELSVIKKVYWYLNYVLSKIYDKKLCAIKKLYVSKEDMKYDGNKNSFFFKIPADLSISSQYGSEVVNKECILFRGGMTFEPNLTAIQYFYHEIFLKLIRIYPNIQLKIVGTLPSQNVKSRLNSNTVFTGFVDNVYQEMSQSALHIVPMCSGTGVKTKMLDSIALKRLVFCTPISINGIFESVEEAVANGIVVFDGADSFIGQFDKFLSGSIDYKDKVDKAYNYCKNNSYSKKVDEILEVVKKELD